MKSLSHASYFPKAALFLIIADFVSNGQTSKDAPIRERDVRAEMTFLAGDAMQGRGSGTMFERIAAEYIGSQFMQFGLEPAGEMGPNGKPTYVQSVTIDRRSFETRRANSVKRRLNT